MLFGGAVVGKMFDDYGPALLLIMGTFLHFVGLILASFSTTYGSIMFSQAVVSAVGASFVFYPAFHCVSRFGS